MSEANLRYFFEAARFGSMRAAAEKLGVAVSSVSRQIAQLELDMGVSLIEHGRRSIKLTEAGELALDYYRARLGQKEAFERQLAELKGLRAGKVELAIDEGFSSTELPDVLAQFMAKYSGLSLEVRAADPKELVRMVVEDEVHLGLPFNAPRDPRLRTRTAVGAPLRVVVSVAHPLARCDRLSLAELAGFRLVLPDRSFDVIQLLRDAERREGVQLQPSLQTNSLSLLTGLVRCGDAVTILPDFVVASDVARGAAACIPLVDPFLGGTMVSLVSRLGRQVPAAASRLMTALEARLNSWLDPEEKRRAG